MWDKIQIQTNEGEKTGIAPLIISASRSTDIPAFYMDWFMNKLKKGYVKWINPFDRKPQYISFEKTKVFVFWSKNPKDLIDRTKEIEDLGKTFYVQYTINDYEKERYEPGLPSLLERIETFKSLSEKIGKERVLWRYDPLFCADNLSPDDLLVKIESIGENLSKYTNKLIFSYADIDKYRKVAANLKRKKIQYREFNTDEKEYLAAGIARLTKKWGIKACTCGESIDLRKYGIAHNKCIDDKLILQILPNDFEIREFLKTGSSRQMDLFGDAQKEAAALKDKGQRAECLCIPSKDIGAYNTCRHMCVYCYANTSEEIVKKNSTRINVANEALLE